MLATQLATNLSSDVGAALNLKVFLTEEKEHRKQKDKKSELTISICM